ncbi:exodeoxyribonuclease VII small subunit [Sphingobacterium cavernae]|uniref:exodeoxyribonuclease VII small subunit n=1 Tax=Sphingobacterium cavernae TaxID=2592657 RepID=UPI00122FBA6E|nr:exodeoxyribonuclease VII small subunit [Sphingobacterium cavernae]
MESNYNYIDAFNELQQIVADIEIGDVNVDELASKIKRASELIAVCKAKLIASEEEVERLLSQLSAEEPTEEEE